MATDTLGLDDSQRLERMQALAGIGLWEWHPQTDDMYWSSQPRQMFGFGQDEALDNATFRSLVLAEELATFDHTVAEVLGGQQQFRAIQRRYLADHRTVRVLQIACESFATTAARSSACWAPAPTSPSSRPSATRSPTSRRPTRSPRGSCYCACATVAPPSCRPASSRRRSAARSRRGSIAGWSRAPSPHCRRRRPGDVACACRST